MIELNMSRGDIHVKVKLVEEEGMYVNNRGILEKIAELLDSVDLYEEIDVSIKQVKPPHTDSTLTVTSFDTSLDTITITGMDGIRSTFTSLDIE